MEALFWILVVVVALALVAAVMVEMRRRRVGDVVTEPAPPHVVPDPAGPENPIQRQIRREGGRV